MQPKQIDGLWHAVYPWGEGGHGIYKTAGLMRVEYDRLMQAHCPYGRAGDRLWVRETLRRIDEGPASEQWCYGADGTAVTLSKDDPRAPAMLSWAHHKGGDVCTSIHMPRWASRLILDITEIRIERLNMISEPDADAEGVLAMWGQARAAFERLWNSINGKRAPWSSNPFVYAISFKRIEA